MNFANFEEVVHNFGWSDFQYMQTWFDAQIDQKNLGWYLLPTVQALKFKRLFAIWIGTATTVN